MKEFIFLLEYTTGQNSVKIEAENIAAAKAIINKTIHFENTPLVAIVGQIVKLESVKYGAYIKILTGLNKCTKKMYEKLKFDQSLKKYELQDNDDISRFRYLKKDKKVLIDFDY